MSDTTFENWMKKVDQAVNNIVGVSYMDLPDIDYRDLFDGGSTPTEAATEALANAGWSVSGNGVMWGV